MISTSLKTPQDLFGIRWIPDPIAWVNYIDAFSFGMWDRWAINTVIITLVSMVGVVFSSAMVAYAFARLRWWGRETLFKLVLATMMLPSVVTLIPQFILFARLPAFGLQGSEVWINTFLPLTVPAFTANAFYIFLLRQTGVGRHCHLRLSRRLAGLYGAAHLLTKRTALHPSNNYGHLAKKYKFCKIAVFIASVSTIRV